jgi:hypothetical protein
MNLEAFEMHKTRLKVGRLSERRTVGYTASAEEKEVVIRAKRRDLYRY